MMGHARAATAAVLFAFSLSPASLPALDKPSRASVQPVAALADEEDPPKPASPAPATSAGLREEIRDLARKGLLDSALALCRRALELDSNDAYARFMAGKLSPEGKASADHFKRVLESGKAGPEAEESRFRLGQFHYAAGKYYLAIPFFRDYIRLNPKGDWKEPAHYWMGNACLTFALSRTDRNAYLDTALAYHQKLLEISPATHYYHALALEGIAKVKLAKGDPAGAWETLQGALQNAPEDERASILLLAAQLRRNVDREEEKRLLEKLAREHPQSPEVRHLRKLNGGSDPAKWRAPAVPRLVLGPTQAEGGNSQGGQGGKPLVVDTTAAAAAPTAETRKDSSQGGVPAAQAGGFTLQLGAFAQAGNAQGMLADLSKMGFAPELSETIRGGKKIYQVRLGRFPTAEAAQEYARVNLKPRKLLSQAVPVN